MGSSPAKRASDPAALRDPPGAAAPPGAAQPAQDDLTWAISSAWLERLSYTQKVGGSSPSSPTMLKDQERSCCGSFWICEQAPIPPSGRRLAASGPNW